MNTCLLDVLHDCTDHGRFAIRDAIDVDFDSVFQKAIDKHRTIRRDFNCACHVTPEIFFIIDKLHGASAENEARPNEYWIADFSGNCDGVFSARRRSVRRLAQAQFVQHGCEQLPIFRCLDAFGLCAQNWYACSLQSTRQVQRRLTTELDEHALRFLLVANVEHVFEGERLEVELVTSVVIGGNCLRI